MNINEVLNKKFNDAIKKSYLTKKEFINQLSHTMDSVCIGAGKSILKNGQPQADIKHAKMNDFPHYNEVNEKLSIKALKANPNTWFVYVPCQSLAKPLSIQAFSNIMNATIGCTLYPYGLNMNRYEVRHELKQLI